MTCCELVLRFCLGNILLSRLSTAGPLRLNDEEKAAGWETRNDITYSPTVTTVDGLPHDQYDEWYVFEKPADHLGRLIPSETNVFEVAPCKGVVHVFVNFGGRVLLPEMKDLAVLFWQQLDWIRPESYLGDEDFLTFVSRNKSLFAAVLRSLSGAR